MIDAVTFRKCIDVFDQSTVILLVECVLLILCINDFNFSIPWSQRKNISSIYLHNKCGLNSTFRRIFSSNFSINRLLQQRANFAWIAVPLFYVTIFLPNLKILCLSTTSARSESVLLEIYFSIRLSYCSRQVQISPPCVGYFGIDQLHPQYIK